MRAYIERTRECPQKGAQGCKWMQNLANEKVKVKMNFLVHLVMYKRV